MRKISILIVLCTVFTGLYAQNGGFVKGTVTTSDGKPAAAVSVDLKGTKKQTLTDEDGHFQLRNIPVGNYTIEVSLVGYEKITQAITVQADKSSSVALTLNVSDKELQEVVVKAGKSSYKVNRGSPTLRIQTPLIELAQNVQVVTSKLISDQQIFSMLEGVTRNVSGVSRSEHWDNYANIVMRGQQIGSFRNGMNVQMPWGPLTEDMSMVERIEFVKGPAGFMLANGEPTGFYNVVTKKPTGITKGEATFTMGSFDTYRATADLDGKLSDNGKVLYRFNLMGQTAGSHRDFDYNNRYSFVPVITYKVNDNTSLTAEYTYQFSRMAMVGSAYVFSPNGYGDLPRNFTTAEPNLEPTDIKDQSIFLTLNHQINTNWKFTTQLAYLNYNQVGYSMWPSLLDAQGNMTRSVGIWDAFSESKLGQAFLTGDVTTGVVRHRILGGIDQGYKNYMADWNQSATLVGTDGSGNEVPFNIYNPVHGNVPAANLPAFDRSKPLKARAGSNLMGESYTSVYVQDELGLLKEKIRLTLAGRYTTIKQNSYGSYADDKQFTPRIGVSVSIDKETAVYGLYDQAFVPQQGYDSLKLRPLVPVTGNNIELGIKKDWFGGRWNSTISVYQIIRNNVVSYRPGLTNFATQLGQSKTKGIEFDVRGELTRGLNLTFNYAYTEAKISKDEDATKIGNIVPGSGFAKNISNAWLSYTVPSGKVKGLGASLGYQWQGSRIAWDWGSNSSASLTDYFRVDGNISWQSNQFSVALNVNNILNKYLYLGAPYDIDWDGHSEYYYQIEPGTNFRLSFGYKF